VSDDDLRRRHQEATAHAESLRVAATQACQVFDGLTSQALEGANIGDEEIAAAARHAAQTEAAARQAEEQAEALGAPPPR
jgi:hypothetical protein